MRVLGQFEDWARTNSDHPVVQWKRGSPIAAFQVWGNCLHTRIQWRSAGEGTQCRDKELRLLTAMSHRIFRQLLPHGRSFGTLFIAYQTGAVSHDAFKKSQMRHYDLQPANTVAILDLSSSWSLDSSNLQSQQTNLKLGNSNPLLAQKNPELWSSLFLVLAMGPYGSWAASPSLHAGLVPHRLPGTVPTSKAANDQAMRASEWTVALRLLQEAEGQQLRLATWCFSPTLLWTGVFSPNKTPVGSGAASTPGSGQGSGGYRRFRCKYWGQVPEGSGAELAEVLEGSGAEPRWGFGGFRCRRIPLQIFGEVGTVPLQIS